MEGLGGALAAVPLGWVRRVAVCGFAGTGLEAALEARGIHVRVVEDFARGYRFDAVFLDLRETEERTGAALLEGAAARLTPFAFVFVVGGGMTPGLRVYREGIVAGVVLRTMVGADYDPVAHGAGLREGGQPGWAIEVLEGVPEGWLAGDSARGGYYAERLGSLLAYDAVAGPEGRLNRFARAQDDFYKATTFSPRCLQAFRDWAAFWARMGRADRAKALLGTARALGDTVEVEAAPQVLVAERSLEYRTGVVSRVLYVMRPPADYGADVLYDGLCAVLGDENVVEYPWKPMLHGEDFARAGGYPCTFQRGGAPDSLGDLVAALRGGRFDAVLYTDVFQEVPGAEVRAIMGAAGDTPVFIVDCWDQCGDYNAMVRAHMGGVPLRGIFKREMVAGLDYGPGVVPLSFAYPDDRIVEIDNWEARRGCFWAGNAQLGLRRTYLEWLAERTGLDVHRRFTQAEYLREIRQASFGLSFFGNGYDTVRYWELPANGCMLLSERPPIRIRNNFVDGESAVFFDDIADLEEKLRHYSAHPEEAAEVARAGYAHLRRYHTGSGRARELLAWIGDFGCW